MEYGISKGFGTKAVKFRKSRGGYQLFIELRTLAELGCRDPSCAVIHKNVDVQNISRVSLGTLRFLERLCTHIEHYKNQVLKTAQNHRAKWLQKAHFEHFLAPCG